MTATKRTDIHRPVDMDPADYEYLYADDNQRPGRLIGVDMNWWASITHWDPATRERSVYQCHHCGARIRYFAILRHIPTGFSIAVGETCLDGRFELESKAEFDRLRKAAELDRQKMRIKTAAAEFVAGLEGTAKIVLDRETDITETFGVEEGTYAFSTIMDIRRKLWDVYGSIFPGALNLAVKLAEEARPRAERQARIEAARAAEVKVPAPEGRIKFSGVVIKREWRESEFGGAFKLVVKVTETDGVWLCWLSEPSKASCERGDVIEITATLSRSDRDESFAFGKRPHGLKVTGHDDIDMDDSLTD